MLFIVGGGDGDGDGGHRLPFFRVNKLSSFLDVELCHFGFSSSYTWDFATMRNAKCKDISFIILITLNHHDLFGHYSSVRIPIVVPRRITNGWREKSCKLQQPIPTLPRPTETLDGIKSGNKTESFEMELNAGAFIELLHFEGWRRRRGVGGSNEKVH